MVERAINADALVCDDRHCGVCFLYYEHFRVYGNRLERAFRMARICAMSDTLRKAGESVERRGFLDGDQAEAFYDPILMAQIGRLMEEVGEFGRSCRSVRGPSASELADVVIVCAAIAKHLNINLDEAVAYKCAADEEKRGYRHSGMQPELISISNGYNGERP